MGRQTDLTCAAARAAALELMSSAGRFVLCGHERPDGDCAGAQAALASVLESLGKAVWIVNPDPLPSGLEHLTKTRRFEVLRGAELPPHDVAVLLDFSEPGRCGPLAGPLLAAASRKLVVDHHPCAHQPWWDAAYIDPGAAATGLLVHRIARELGARLDAAGALGVFTALASDTGWFRYSNTDAEALSVAAELVAGGLDPAGLYRQMYQRAGRERPLGIARALARLDYLAAGRLAVVDLPLPDAEEADLPEGDEVLDLLRAVESVEVALFLRETRSGSVHLSARAKGGCDVLGLARRFGGGGHSKASGATLPGPLVAARDAVVAAALEELGGRQGHTA